MTRIKLNSISMNKEIFFIVPNINRRQRHSRPPGSNRSWALCCAVGEQDFNGCVQEVIA